MHLSQVAVVTNNNVGWDPVIFAALCQISDMLPVPLVCSAYGFESELKSGVGYCCVVLPDILIRCLASRKFRMACSSEKLLNGRSSCRFSESDDELPVLVICTVS